MTSTFRSNFEREIAEALTKKHIQFQYEPAPISLFIKKVGMCFSCSSENIGVKKKYTPDFLVFPRDEKHHAIYLECKGHWKSKERTVLLTLLEYGWHVEMVFMKDNWLTKKHNRRYSDWCREHGVNYIIWDGKIPAGWLF